MSKILIFLTKLNLMKSFLSLSISFVMLFTLCGFVEVPSLDFASPLLSENIAQLNDDYSITLDESKPISANYVADISHFRSNMPNQVEAEKFISNFSKPYIKISVDLSKNKAYILLEFNEKTEVWTAKDWNTKLLK
jgi:hypothetical protein